MPDASAETLDRPKVSWWQRHKQRKQHKQVVLLVMCADDMHVAHPETDFSRTCPDCGEQVGIYPSGQQVLRRHKNVKLVCNRCAPPGSGFGQPAPGAEVEPLQSIPSWLVRRR